MDAIWIFHKNVPPRWSELDHFSSGRQYRNGGGTQALEQAVEIVHGYRHGRRTGILNAEVKRPPGEIFEFIKRD